MSVLVLCEKNKLYKCLHNDDDDDDGRQARRMNYDLTDEEVEIIRECVLIARDALMDVVARMQGSGSSRARQDALIKIRNCNDVLTSLGEQPRFDGAGKLKLDH